MRCGTTGAINNDKISWRYQGYHHVCLISEDMLRDENTRRADAKRPTALASHEGLLDRRASGPIPNPSESESAFGKTHR